VVQAAQGADTARAQRGRAKKGIAAVNAYQITEHTGTQIDFPPHFIPPPGTNVPGSPGRAIGRMSGDKFPLTNLMGPPVVLDCGRCLPRTPPRARARRCPRTGSPAGRRGSGASTRAACPCCSSGYTDRYYKRFPDGNRFKDRLLWKPLIDKSTPAWVVLAPDAIELLSTRGVKHVATDAPSFGAAEEPQASHVAGLKHGMTWTESAIGLGRLPQRGAFYICAPYKVQEQQAGIVRAFAFSPKGAAAVQGGPPLRL
jgi:kynurenine formamidase